MKCVITSFIFVVVCASVVSGTQPLVKQTSNGIELPPVRWSYAAAPGSNIPDHVLGAVASATIMLHESLFQQIASSVLPAIIAEVKNIQIPGEKGHDFSFNTIVLSEFNIGGLTITFAAPNRVQVQVTGLSLATPKTNFDVWKRIIFKISCGGEFDVSMSNTNMAIVFALNDNGGVLGIVDVSANVVFGNLNIHHEFPNFFCKVGQDIIQLFIGNIDNKIRNMVEKEISPIMTNVMSKALSEMAARMKLPVLSQPTATADSISFEVNLLQHGQRRHKLHTRRTRPTVRAGAFPSREIEVMVPQASFDTIFAVIQASGALSRTVKLNATTAVFKNLIPAAYAACPGCPLVLAMNVQRAPTAMFSGSASFALSDAVLGLNALNGSLSVDLVDLLLNATLVTSNFTIKGALGNVVYFTISVPTFSVGLQKSNIGPIDVALLNSLANLLIQDYLVPTFNRDFTGIPISGIAGVTIENIELLFQNSMDVGLDIKLPPLASE